MNSKAVCPKCTSSDAVIPITYGKPAQSLIDKANKGEVRLGGCCPSKQRHYCKKCNHSFA